MAVNAPRHNYLEPVQDVKTCLSIMPLFCMVTSDLIDRNQFALLHSPFLVFTFGFEWVNNSCERIFYSGGNSMTGKFLHFNN